MLIARSTSSCALAYEGEPITRNIAVALELVHSRSERGWNPLDDEDVSLNASELDSASLHKVLVVKLPDWLKPAIDEEATSNGTHRTIRGDWRRRVSKDNHGTPGDPIHGVRRGNPVRQKASGNHNRCRMWHRESERLIVVKKWGNAHGTKGPYFSHVSIEARRSA